MKPGLEKVERILVVKLRAIGDSVLTLPSIAELRKGFPKAQISVLWPKHSVELLQADSRVDEVIAYPGKDLKALGDHADFFGSLQARHFDLALCFHASFRTALIAWMSGASLRVVRNHSGRDWFSNVRATEPKEPKSIIERDFDVLRALGLQPKNRAPKIIIPAASKKRAAVLARQAGLAKGRSVLLFSGAGKAEKRWPMESFLGLQAALKKKKIKSALLLGPGEPGPAEALRLGSLLDLAALCAHAGYAIGNDSGPRHIAAASGAKTLTLFGPEGLREWHPYAADEGHWALQAESGLVADLSLDQVLKKTWEWMQA